nr:phospholipase A2-like [Nerophis lumbriciformis]
MTAFRHTLLLFAVASASVASAVAVSPQRSKRSLMELRDMIRCSTDRSPLDYLSYGCYCGVGGQGRPLDSTDWCCHKHDCCYGDAQRQGCKPISYRYKWTCNDRTPNQYHARKSYKAFKAGVWNLFG